MKIKVFSFSKSFLSLWHVPSGKIEPEIGNWLAGNPGIEVKEIKHDSFHGIWHSPQLIVTIYYTDK